jgi:hypothetical protein
VNGDLVVRVRTDDPAAARVWADMLTLAMREGCTVAVVTGNPQAGVSERFEGVLLEVEPHWLRVQPVDGLGVPVAPTEYLLRTSIDHVVVYGPQSPGVLALHDGAMIGGGKR